MQQLIVNLAVRGTVVGIIAIDIVAVAVADVNTSTDYSSMGSALSSARIGTIAVAVVVIGDTTCRGFTFGLDY